MQVPAETTKTSRLSAMQLSMETAPDYVFDEQCIEQGLVKTRTRLFAYGYRSSVLEHHIFIYYFKYHYITQVSCIIFVNFVNYSGYLSFNKILIIHFPAFYGIKLFPPQMSAVAVGNRAKERFGDEQKNADDK